ncbi:hypothetical protein C7B77_18495 [Chamaesiphon polymorphus CCALA 037]|uniref:Uncharacterized protein n=1 Tax=Chamaesiphon polymorphus CCALA 037 TaxID=2107692 RepID=A0A2T1GAU6_9CYAN|nr:hypothetical protein C7B77_18495 [Chamaesiphon polymorphus CCALA 037]
MFAFDGKHQIEAHKTIIYRGDRLRSRFTKVTLSEDAIICKLLVISAGRLARSENYRAMFARIN